VSCKRRLAVIVGIVVLALLVCWLFGALTGGSKTPGSTPGTTPGATTSPGSTLSAAPTVSADPSRPCTDADITVVTTSAATFTGDTLPTFKVTVTSKASSPCVVDPTVDSKILIVSGSDTWFDSSTCAGYNVYNAEKFVIEPAATHDLATGWNRGRDAAGCSTDAQPADTGSYWVTATVQGITAEKVQFALG
jgi:hypothetical protein